jgi:hypothetical protein
VNFAGQIPDGKNYTHPEHTPATQTDWSVCPKAQSHKTPVLWHYG